MEEDWVVLVSDKSRESLEESVFIDFLLHWHSKLEEVARMFPVNPTWNKVRLSHQHLPQWNHPEQTAAHILSY